MSDAELIRRSDALARMNAARDANTCPVSRHAAMIAEALVNGEPYAMLSEEPKYCGETIAAVVASLWETRTALTAANARIEALTKERDEADDLAKAAFADGASNNIRLAETSYRVKWLEAKLAKAVEALEYYAGRVTYRLCDDCPVQVHKSADLSGPARATLAEIKGESQDGMV